jgi:hypothetical protein
VCRSIDRSRVIYERRRDGVSVRPDSRASRKQPMQAATGIDREEKGREDVCASCRAGRSKDEIKRHPRTRCTGSTMVHAWMDGDRGCPRPVLGIWAGPLFEPVRARPESMSPKHGLTRNNMGRAITVRRRVWVGPQISVRRAPARPHRWTGLGPTRPN